MASERATNGGSAARAGEVAVSAPFALAGRPATGRSARSFKPRRGRLSAAEREAVEVFLPTYLIPTSTVPLAERSLVVDIGFGDGETTLQLASEHPRHHVLAIDIHTPGFGVLARRLAERSITNVSIVDADALDVVTWMCAPLSIAVVNVAFPDPWPKVGQQHRRLVDAAFADLLASRLETNGEFRFATDWAPYAKAVQTLFDADDRFDSCETWSTRPTTKYERKGTAAGRDSTDLAYRRVATSSTVSSTARLHHMSASPTSAAGLLTEIDHVAIAVHDLEAAVKYYADVYGATVDHREIVERDGVEEALLKVADSYVQLLTPTRPDSPVAKYLEKKGEGLHHVGYRVADCAAALDAVKAAGGKVIDDAPRPGSRNTMVAFIHPKTTFGTLVELVQE